MKSYLCDERGQVAPFVALVAVTAGLACLALGRFGGTAVLHAQARTAADAAALAGAAGGADEASRLAEANGGQVTAFEKAGGDARVEATVGAMGPSGPLSGEPAPAQARARREGEVIRPGEAAPPGAVPLAPGLRAALARAAQLLGRPVPTLGRPSPPDGQRDGVAPPGSSMHERGLAVDVAPSAAEEVAELAPQAGLCRPYPRTYPAHFELAGTESACPRH